MDDLLHLARRMMLRAHAPYSKFHVGAAVRGEDGSIHGGCNVENAAYPQGLCAEASAIAAMVAAGQKRILECVVVEDHRPAVMTAEELVQRSDYLALADVDLAGQTDVTECASSSSDGVL